MKAFRAFLSACATLTLLCFKEGAAFIPSIQRRHNAVRGRYDAIRGRYDQVVYLGGCDPDKDSESIVVAATEKLVKERRIKQAGIGAGSFLLSTALFLQSVISDEPLIGLVPIAALVAVLITSYRPVLAFTPPLEQGTDFEVQNASGKGKGVFALVPISANTYLFDYEGEFLTEEDLMQRYPPCADTGLSTTDYVIELTYRDPFAFDPIYCDAADEQKSNVARFLNHGTNAASHNVRKEYQRFPTRRIRFFTTRDIKVGEELQWDYGADYWIGREGLMSE